MVKKCIDEQTYTLQEAKQKGLWPYDTDRERQVGDTLAKLREELKATYKDAGKVDIEITNNKITMTVSFVTRKKWGELKKMTFNIITEERKASG